jgi:hypothetical protein
MDFCRGCGTGLDPYNQEIVVIPHSYMHRQCQEATGKTPSQIREDEMCCKSREALLGMAGSVLEKRSTVPFDFYWVYDRESNRYARYRVQPYGNIVLARVEPDIVLAGAVSRTDEKDEDEDA